jgi:hypothetical protein
MIITNRWSSPPGGRTEPLVQSTRTEGHDSDSGRLLNSMFCRFGAGQPLSEQRVCYGYLVVTRCEMLDETLNATYYVVWRLK